MRSYRAKPWKRANALVQRVVEELLDDRGVRSAVDLRHELAQDSRIREARKTGALKEDDLPDERKARRWVRSWLEGEPDESGDDEPWSMADATPDDAAIIIPLLPTLLEKTGGRRDGVTKGEAKWIIKLRRCAEGLDDWKLYRFARAYRDRERHDHGMTDLNVFLSFKTWTKAGRDRWLTFGESLDDTTALTEDEVPSWLVNAYLHWDNEDKQA